MELVDLEIGYSGHGTKTVIGKALNAEIKKGELTCLLGPNGIGKSTLLRTMSGAQPPMGGKILLNGRNLTDYTPGELARNIGVVLTERLNLANMTVKEVVALGRSPYTGFFGLLREKDEYVVAESIRSVGISNLVDRRISTLSDGERQKVMIAKALAQETSIILLDEPTSFLDFPSKIDTMLLLKQLAREKSKTVFLSTHDLETVMQTADTLWLIDKEKGLSVGSVNELAEKGCIGRYFDTDSIVFDSDTRRFCLRHTKI